jgi:hypothetical protein
MPEKRERYPILRKRLDQDGCDVGTEEFREIVCGIFVACYRGPDEELLCRPSEAAKYVELVRQKVSAQVDEYTICRTLTNCRKSEADELDRDL